jgi:hypothetical protein
MNLLKDKPYVIGRVVVALFTIFIIGSIIILHVDRMNDEKEYSEDYSYAVQFMQDGGITSVKDAGCKIDNFCSRWVSLVNDAKDKKVGGESVQIVYVENQVEKHATLSRDGSHVTIKDVDKK